MHCHVDINLDAATGLSLDLDMATGDYKVKVKDQDWLLSEDAFITVDGKVTFEIIVLSV